MGDRHTKGGKACDNWLSESGGRPCERKGAIKGKKTLKKTNHAHVMQMADVLGGHREEVVSESETLAESSAIYIDACALAKIDLEEDPCSGLVRCLVYLSRIPVYCSMVGIGEFVTVAGKKLTQAQIGSAGYLYKCRSLLVDVEVGKLRRIEPVADRFAFIQEAEYLLSRHSSLGGGDLWHIMAARQLSRCHSPSTLFSFDKDLVEAAVSEGVRAVYGGRVDREILIRELTVRGKWVSA